MGSTESQGAHKKAFESSKSLLSNKNALRLPTLTVCLNSIKNDLYQMTIYGTRIFYRYKEAEPIVFTSFEQRHKITAQSISQVHGAYSIIVL